MNKNQREAQQRQEDKALNRGLIWVGAAIVLEALLLLVNRYYINFRSTAAEIRLAETLNGVLSAVRLLGLVGAVACLVWLALWLRAGKGVKLPAALTCGAGALALCAHVTLAFSNQGMRMLFLLVPALAGLALVYYLYQREFFLAASAGGLAVLGLWFVRYGGRCLEAVLALAGVALLGAAALWLKKNGGVVAQGEQEFRILSKNAAYPVILASCAVGLVAVAAALVLGATVAYYLLFAMVAWLFGLLVYYTVKLM